MEFTVQEFCMSHAMFSLKEFYFFLFLTVWVFHVPGLTILSCQDTPIGLLLQSSLGIRSIVVKALPSLTLPVYFPWRAVS